MSRLVIIELVSLDGRRRLLLAAIASCSAEDAIAVCIIEIRNFARLFGLAMR